jgi:hypothetical protein
MNTDGLSAQKAGSSTADLVSSTNGGAVMFERSPRMTEIDCENDGVSTWNLGLCSRLHRIGFPRIQAKHLQFETYSNEIF